MLDLSNAASYRDLSKPVGAQNSTRLEATLTKFEWLKNADDAGMPPFMWGSHYSTAAGVLYEFCAALYGLCGGGARLHRMGYVVVGLDCSQRFMLRPIGEL